MLSRTNPLIETIVSNYVASVNVESSQARDRRILGQWSRFKVIAGNAELPVGKLRIRWLEPSHGHAWIVSLQARELLPQTIKNYVTTVRRALRYARANRWISDSPDVLMPAAPRTSLKPPDSLSNEELARTILGARARVTKVWPAGEAELLIRLQSDCGLRPSEAYWLGHNEIHLDRGCIRLSGAMRRLKNGRAARVIPIPQHLTPLLSTVAQRPGPYLFAHANKHAPYSSTRRPWGYMFDPLKRALEIERLTAQILRHTFATRYVELHRNSPSLVWDLCQLMGHSSIAVTQAYYIKPKPPEFLTLTDVLETVTV